MPLSIGTRRPAAGEADLIQQAAHSRRRHGFQVGKEEQGFEPGEVVVEHDVSGR